MSTHSKLSNNRTRRWVLGAGLASVGMGTVLAGTYFNVFADAEAAGALSVEEANGRAEDGAIYLVDIRRPDEWQRTGVGAAAIPIDMRREDFVSVLQMIFDEAGARPVALICARGVRSQRLTSRLEAAGFAEIINVPEGMFGSGAGPGWIAQDLPLRAPTSDEMAGRVHALIQRS